MDTKITETKNREYYTIDILHVAKELLNRIWLIVLAGFLAATLGFSIAAFLITPTYSSSIMLYVNNRSTSMSNPNFSISSSEIAAAQSLVRTYSEILKNRTTLEKVVDKADLPYDDKDLYKMIKAEPSNNTEIMKITVTTEDPIEAAKIANCIAEVLPIRIAEIIDGASMEVVEYAIPNPEKVAPSITKYTIYGLLLGIFAAVAAVVVAALLDDTIHDEEYVLQNYGCPILAKIPDLMGSSGKKYKYGYYYQSRHYYKSHDN